MIGTTLMSRFEIEDRVGSGGFGTVYRAWDRRLERDVAVKVIETDRGSGPRIQREARAAARLNHPGIVTLFEFTHHEFGADGGRAFLVSELIEGDTVRELIDRRLLNDRDVGEIGADVCEALDHAHARGVVHRDIKPANLMVPHRDGGARLMDFGIARLLDGDDLTVTGDVLGTLSYMSPEQAEGLEVGPPGDVFSLALTLYEAWTGENPRRRSTPGATARALGEDVPPLARLRPDLPPPVCDVIDSCLDFEPEYRPVVEDLGTVLEENLCDLDDSLVAPAPLPGGLSSRFAFRGGFDLTGILAAVAAGGMTAAAMIVSGAADAGSVALLTLTVSILALLSPRLGFLACGVGLAGWLNFAAGMAGAAFGVALLVALPAMLIRGSGRILAVVPFAPIFGIVGLAPAAPALAALAGNRRDRATVAVAALTLTALAEAVTGRGLLFGRFAEVPAGWEQSVSAFLGDLLIPIVTSSTYLVALAVWLVIAVVLGALVARVRDRRGAPRPQVMSLAAVESDRVPNAQ